MGRDTTVARRSGVSTLWGARVQNSALNPYLSMGICVVLSHSDVSNIRLPAPLVSSGRVNKTVRRCE
eukprot:6879626-Prymnesium_polylepis.1